MRHRKVYRLILLCCLSGLLFPVVAQVRVPLNSSRGMDASLLTGGKVVCFSKGPGKRTLYVAGSQLKVKLLNGTKVAGRVNVVQDTGFMLAGRMISYDSIAAYYVPMRVGIYAGTALCVAGGGYILMEGLNTGFGLMMGKKKKFHMEALEVGLPILAVGAALIPFREVKRRTSVWRVRTLDL